MRKRDDKLNQEIVSFLMFHFVRGLLALGKNVALPMNFHNANYFIIFLQLAGSTGNILENKELLSSLNETKRKTAVIADSLKESLDLQESLEKEGNAYLPLAKFASQLFFAIYDMIKLDNMYRLSLVAFTGIYRRTLKVNFI